MSEHKPILLINKKNLLTESLDFYENSDLYISDVYCSCYKSELKKPLVCVPIDRDLECMDWIDDNCYTDGTIDAAMNTKNMR